MPCNSDYLRPDSREQELHRAAKLLVYVRKCQSKKPERFAVKAANDVYGAGGEKALVLLCEALTNMSESERNIIVYNSRLKIVRDLADWWEDHQEADRQRIAEEKRRKHQKKLRKHALAKLSKDEREALGVH